MSPQHHHVAAITSAAADVSALTLVVLLAAVAGCVASGIGWRRIRTVVIAGAVAGGVFQLGHLVEHLAQSGYWVVHRSEAQWMTPWARALADSYQSWAPGVPGLGMELLHLVGNAIFLAGALAIVTVLRFAALPADLRVARVGIGVQVVHVAEHVALTASVVAAGRPVGVSTLFGTVGAGPSIWTYRVWWHMTINAVATLLIAIALFRHVRRAHERRSPVPALRGQPA